MVEAPSLPTLVWQVLVLLALVVSGGVVWRIARPNGEWGARLRSRFVLGIPWGTLLAMGVVLGVYLFVQGGYGSWYSPVVIAFRAWSYFYPLGIIFSGLAHSGPGHLIGNLLATATFGILAEYAWGHFPSERGVSTFSSRWTNPYVRIAVFPLVAVALAVFSGAFSLGPVIGFSGVVFAFAGFALIRYPLTTVVLLAVGDAVRLVFRAIRTPQLTAEASPSFSTPWWAGIAIQGHAIGLFAGVVLAIFLFRYRDAMPAAGRLWAAVVAFAASQGLWAVYLILGNGRFVLYRGLGVVIVLLLAALLTAAVAASDRALIARIDLSRQEAATLVVASVLLALATVAVPFNLLEVGEEAVPEEATTVEVDDYTVFYAENVENRLVTAFDVPFYNGSSVRESGVVVVSQERHIWWTAVSKGRLAFDGRGSVVVGGPGWRERVIATRVGWSAVGGPTTYKVFLQNEGTKRLAYTADPAPAEPVIEGRNVSVVPTIDGFALRVSQANRTLDTAPIPEGNETTTAAGGLTFIRNDSAVFAVVNETRVRIATDASK